MKTRVIRRVAVETPKKLGSIRSIPALPFKASVDLADVIDTAREIQIRTGYVGWDGTNGSKSRRSTATHTTKRSKPPAIKK